MPTMDTLSFLLPWQIFLVKSQATPDRRPVKLPTLSFPSPPNPLLTAILQPQTWKDTPCWMTSHKATSTSTSNLGGDFLLEQKPSSPPELLPPTWAETLCFIRDYASHQKPDPKASGDYLLTFRPYKPEYRKGNRNQQKNILPKKKTSSEIDT